MQKTVNKSTRPRYVSMRQAPKYIDGITENFIRSLNKRGLLPGPCSGVKKYVDLERFEAMLDAGEFDRIDSEVTADA